MRDAYHEELAAITDQLVQMTRLVGDAITRGTQALLTADLAIAETVIDGDEAVDNLRENVERRTVDLIARQQPVAGDLRALTTGLRITSDLERSGDLATHIAKLARRKFPAHAVPAELQDTIREMGEVAAKIVQKAGDVVASRDADRASELEADDDVMDDLHRRLLRTMLAPEWTYGVDTAIDLALAGRYYERFADHAVAVARQVVYLVTGETVMRS
ncbi:MAG: phosphate transport system protein [Actinomycetota bacterium]|nr:phosphate transport system protein [Actinomycetota bacterium]